ncbi:MAG: chemotaxis protein CheW [Pseudomonadota bacterium]
MKDLLLVAHIGGRQCAFDAIDVQSVIELDEVTPVPGTFDHIAGIAALRSQTLTVICCRKALGIDTRKLSLDHRAVVVTVRGHSYALKVDKIEDITTGVISPETVLGGFGDEWSRVATGMIETTLGPSLLLDLPQLIEAISDDVRAVA